MALVKLQAEGLNLADTFAFSGTVSGAGGSFTLLSTTNVSSGVAQVDITSNINSTYKDYMIKLTDVHPATDDVRLAFRLFSSQGSPDTGTRYMYAGTGRRSDGSNQTEDSDGDASARFNVGAVGNNSAESTNGEMYLFNPSGTTFNKLINIHSTGMSATGRPMTAIVGVAYDAGSIAYTGIRFFFSSGNIDGGTFKLYGIS